MCLVDRRLLSRPNPPGSECAPPNVCKPGYSKSAIEVADELGRLALITIPYNSPLVTDRNLIHLRSEGHFYENVPCTSTKASGW